MFTKLCTILIVICKQNSNLNAPPRSANKSVLPDAALISGNTSVPIYNFKSTNITLFRLVFGREMQLPNNFAALLFV